LSSLTQIRLAADTTLAKRQLFESIKNPRYRHVFVQERVRSSIALQIRALREQRNRMTQKQLGELLDMAQTWISKLENPEYGKMTVATLLRLAEVFDADLEIKIRPFSTTIHTLPTQGPEYFKVPSFSDEEPEIEKALEREQAKVSAAVARTEQIGLRQLATGTVDIPAWAARLQLAEEAMSLGAGRMTLQQMALTPARGIVENPATQPPAPDKNRGLFIVRVPGNNESAVGRTEDSPQGGDSIDRRGALPSSQNVPFKIPA
jgi:transcriptional regulator with XRE-family HTH domain